MSGWFNNIFNIIVLNILTGKITKTLSSRYIFNNGLYFVNDPYNDYITEFSELTIINYSIVKNKTRYYYKTIFNINYLYDDDVKHTLLKKELLY